MATWREARPLRLLDLDCENRPLSYQGNDFTTPELTAIAYKFVGESDPIQAWVLGHECSSCGHNDGDNLQDMLEGFALVWDEADLISGHNIIKHDLRLLNAMLLEQGMRPLQPKMVCDTYWGLRKRAPGFASQATLSKMLGVRSPKIGMDTPDWRVANRLLPAGLAKTERRVIGDVRQHIQMRKKLLTLGWLRPPTRWSA